LSIQQARDLFNLSVKPIYIWWSLIFIGIVLRLRQYLSGRSLWSDEASLAYNLAHRNFLGLIQPLDYDQGAPVGFLFIEKLLIIVFGNIDQVMRLFPLFSGILALYLFYRIAQAHIKGGMLGMILLALGWELIYYSSELKQYSSDVMIGLLLIFLAYNCLKENAQTRDFLYLGIAGVVGIWISHPSVFILGGIGLAMFVATLTKSRPIPIVWLVGLGAVWLASFGLEYLVALRPLIGNDLLQSYWEKAFLPLPPGGTRIWLIKTYYSMLLIIIGRTDHILVIIFPILISIGGLSLLIRDRTTGILLISPFFFAAVASILQKYPLKDRFMLFLVPLVLLLIAEGLGSIYAIIAKWQRGVAAIVYMLPAVVLIYMSATITSEFVRAPYIGSDIKPVLEYVGHHRLKSEPIYIYYTTVPEYDYYAPLYNLDDENVLFGFRSSVKKEALEGFYDDVKTLRGRGRVWFIFSRILDCGGCKGDMQTYFVDYLNGLGTMLDSFHRTDANAYLYDLNP